MTLAFCLNQSIKVTVLLFVQYINGCLVHYKGVKVNYTRKVNHFLLFFLPLFLDKMFKFEQTPRNLLLSSGIVFIFLFFYAEPFRNRNRFIRRMFLSFDRPEDRPHTLFWISTQIVVSYMVVIPCVLVFKKFGYGELIFIPVLINGIGDGLAEPVGVRFGRLKYQTRALFSNKRYVRSVEGSLCVFITSIIVLLYYKPLFTFEEWLTAMLTVPILMTLTEAVSPHTWDTPFLFSVGYGLIFFIKWLPMLG